MTRFVDGLTLDGSGGGNSLILDGLPGVPSLNIRSGSLQLMRGYIDPSWQYYYYSYDDNYYSNDYSYQPDVNTADMWVRNFASFTGNAAYYLGPQSEDNAPLSYSIEGKGKASVDYRYSDYGITVDFTSGTVTTTRTRDTIRTPYTDVANNNLPLFLQKSA